MSDIEILWKNGEEWVPFPLGDIAHMTMREVCIRFARKVAPDPDSHFKPDTIAKQSGSYVVNSVELQQKYRVQRKRCSTFEEILEKGGERLGKKLSEVGFV